MDTFELKKEQSRLARKIVLNDDFDKVKTIGGAVCVVSGNDLIASVVVCEFPSMKFIEKKTYSLPDPLPYQPGFSAYREMPALIEAYNLLEEEPDVLIIRGSGVLHPRRIGLASHLGLALNKPTIGVTEKLIIGRVENGKIFLGPDVCGFEVKTREHSKPVYISPGHLMSLGSCLHIIKESIQYPHKMPEPLHLAQKIGKKKVKLSIDSSTPAF
ncbi:MAG: endonuclease V [Candidatus Woesearchaeota archaeon]